MDPVTPAVTDSLGLEKLSVHPECRYGVRGTTEFPDDGSTLCFASTLCVKVFKRILNDKS